MARSFFDLVRFNTSTVGTGSIVPGTALAGCRTPAQASVANGTVISYSIMDGANYETGSGTVSSSGTSVSRDTVYTSSSAGAKISLSGTAIVLFDLLASDFGGLPNGGVLYRDVNGDMKGDGNNFGTDGVNVWITNALQFTTATSSLIMGIGRPIFFNQNSGVNVLAYSDGTHFYCKNQSSGGFNIFDSDGGTYFRNLSSQLTAAFASGQTGIYSSTLILGPQNSTAEVFFYGQGPSGTNQPGGNINFYTPFSTGNATNPDFVFWTAQKGVSGTTVATAHEALRIKGETQAVIINSSYANGALQVTGADTFGVGTGALVVVGGGSFSTGLNVGGNGITTNYLSASSQVFTGSLSINSNQAGQSGDGTTYYIFNTATNGSIFFQSKGQSVGLGTLLHSFQLYPSALPALNVYDGGKIELLDHTPNSVRLSVAGNAILQLGDADGGSPAAQTLQAQSGLGSNIAGQAFNIRGARSTGTAVNPDVIFFTGKSTGVSGSGAATYTEALRAKGETQAIQLAGGILALGSSFDSGVTRVAPGVTGFTQGSSTINGWQQWGGQARVTSDFSVTSSIALVNVTGLSVNVAAGRTYAFEACLMVTDAAAGGVKAAIAGTCTATAIEYIGYTVADNAIKGKADATALGATVASTVTTETSGIKVVIQGAITVANAGTLTVQMAQNTSSGTATVAKRGSHFLVYDMP